MTNRRRRGQILFLEFMITLPIFCLLFLAMMSFHRFYTHTAKVSEEARRLAWVASSEEISRKQFDVQRVTIEDRFNDALRQSSPLGVRFGVQTVRAVSTSQVGVPGFLGQAEAVGAVEVSQDGWSHQEIKARSEIKAAPDVMDTIAGNRGTRFQRRTPLQSTNPAKTPNGVRKDLWPTLHGQASEEVLTKYQGLGLPLPAGRQELGDSAASLLYGQSIGDNLTGYIEL